MMFSFFEEQEVKVREEGGEHATHFPGKGNWIPMCVGNAFFLWEPAKGCSGSTKQEFELEYPTIGANRQSTSL